ncbi:uncharacterized protein LOC126968339 isoform X2 [Leptidea sinapis]|uniref:uncharacterized protein LOC126968339 isoform X2 n=1 Tax=Leptidea sinapis TaxID=189913 RepID=UPI0021C41053|nr:uncharacterized protein LOC126968339 isoform X2 [Leptidea sinapis]
MSTRSGVAAIRSRRGHKERSKNFTELEKRTVLELIARHRDVLRQGRSNNATNRSKQLVWSTICEEVNKRCGGDRPRTPAQVKMWYENYKKKCKMRAHDTQVIKSNADAPGILDGMLWQNIHPLDVKGEENDATTSAEGAHSVKDDDCLPVNVSVMTQMSNGRLSITNDSDDTMPNVLEPHVQIIPQSSPTPPLKALPNPHNPLIPTHVPLLANPLAIEQARIQHNFLQKLNEMSNTPLNLSHLDDDRRKNQDNSEKSDEHLKNECGNATEEERLYFTAKRQHAIWEHEAKMKILNMELRQKEEIFSLQKQLFLIELRLKMDFLEKASAK